MKLVYPPFGAVMLDDDGKLVQPWMGWILTLYNIIDKSYSGTIITAKLTGGGANGSITFVNGIVTSQVAAT